MTFRKLINEKLSHSFCSDRMENSMAMKYESENQISTVEDADKLETLERLTDHLDDLENRKKEEHAYCWDS